MADDVHNQDQPESPSQWEPPTAEGELPERLRVHSLARVLGTTSKRVLDALAGLDGRTRSPHSSVDQAEAIRVREALAAADAEFAVESALESDPTAAVIVESEPESRLILETHTVAETVHITESAASATVEQSAYLPLFVAPQPVSVVASAADEDRASDEGEEDGDEADTDGDAADRPANRRRRRGRRGRGRGRGEQAGADGEDDEQTAGEDRASDEDAEDGDEAEGGDEESVNGEGATRRRRRRRRRRTGAGDDAESPSPDDPPNTVVHERTPRSKAERSGSNEIQGISGSTRLEAKRQRRRDGRDAGRRRPPILTEAEIPGPA